MTKQEIIAAIAAKIEGQGSMVDIGGGLPTILNAITALIPDDVPTPQDIFDSLTVRTAKTYGDLSSGISLEDVPKAQVCSALGIAATDLDNMMAGKIFRFMFEGGSFPIGQIIDFSSETTLRVEAIDTGLIVLIVHKKTEDLWILTIQEL